MSRSLARSIGRLVRSVHSDGVERRWRGLVRASHAQTWTLVMRPRQVRVRLADQALATVARLHHAPPFSHSPWEGFMNLRLAYACFSFYGLTWLTIGIGAFLLTVLRGHRS